jgi:transposase
VILCCSAKEGPLKKKVSSVSHGAVFLFWQTAQELDLVNIFNSHFSTQVRDDLTVGESLLLAAIHRAIQPGSKRTFASWAKSTTLPELAVFEADKIDSQHFWDQMDTVTDTQLENVETAITEKMIEQGLFSAKLLFYDLTNFFTYIDSTNHRSQLAQRSRNKQKRNGLRQFGLSQVVTKEFLVPVFSEIYEGNRADRELFVPTLTKLRTKLSELHLDIEEITVVFDKGNNSKDNFAKLDASEIPYVASLTPSYHEDLLEIPRSEYRMVGVNGQGILCYRTRKVVWGKERTIVIYLSQKLKEGQLRGLKQALSKKFEQLRELKAKLNEPKARKRSKEKLEEQIKNIIHGEKCQLLIKVSIEEKEAGRFDIDWDIDTGAYEWKKAREADYDMSLENLIDNLEKVRQAEIITLASLKSKPVREIQLEEMDPKLQELYEMLVK